METTTPRQPDKATLATTVEQVAPQESVQVSSQATPEQKQASPGKPTSAPAKETAKPSSKGTGNLPQEVMDRLLQGSGIDILESPEPEAEKTSSSETKSYLYVEDDMMSREVMKRLFSKVLKLEGLTIFEDSKDFMRRVKALPQVPDIIFLDIQIEPHSGQEMLKMLRSDEVYKDATIIALTASVMAPEVEALKQAGFDGLIAKPIIKKVFPNLLEQITNGKSVWFVS